MILVCSFPEPPAHLRLDSNTWCKLDASGVPPSPRFLHTSVIWRDKLVIFGGLGGNGQVRLNDVHVLDLHKQVWIPSCQTPPWYNFY